MGVGLFPSTRPCNKNSHAPGKTLKRSEYRSGLPAVEGVQILLVKLKLGRRVLLWLPVYEEPRGLVVLFLAAVVRVLQVLGFPLAAKLYELSSRHQLLDLLQGLHSTGHTSIPKNDAVDGVCLAVTTKEELHHHSFLDTVPQ